MVILLNEEYICSYAVPPLFISLHMVLRTPAVKSSNVQNSCKTSQGFAVEDPITDAHLSRLEDEIREALRAHRTVYEGERSILIKMLRYLENTSFI